MRYIEVNTNSSDRCIINLNKVHRIIPVINGVGCVFHFDNGKTQSVSESYEIVKTLLLEPVVEKKESVKEIVEKKEPPKAKS